MFNAFSHELKAYAKEQATGTPQDPDTHRATMKYLLKRLATTDISQIRYLMSSHNNATPDLSRLDTRELEELEEYLDDRRHFPLNKLNRLLYGE